MPHPQPGSITGAGPAGLVAPTGRGTPCPSHPEPRLSPVPAAPRLHFYLPAPPKTL